MGYKCQQHPQVIFRSHSMMLTLEVLIYSSGIIIDIKAWRSSPYIKKGVGWVIMPAAAPRLSSDLINQDRAGLLIEGRKFS